VFRLLCTYLSILFLASLPILLLLGVFRWEGVSFSFLLEFSGLSKQFFRYWWLFFIMVLIVKLPLFVLHLWLPKAHVDAPLLGSIILAGVLLKLGGYGFYKVLVFLFTFYFSLAFFLLSFSLVGRVIMGVVCIRQVDIKRTVAYSSVVHIGPVFCVLLLINYLGVLGSYWIIVSHGLCSACLFFLLDVYYKFLGSRRFFFASRFWVFFACFYFFLVFPLCLQYRFSPFF